MPGAETISSPAAEQESRPDPQVEQTLSAASSNMESAVADANTAEPQSDTVAENIGGNESHQAPISVIEQSQTHHSIDAGKLSVDALMRKCDHFAQWAKIDPAAAKAGATEALKYEREVKAMRDDGMTDDEIIAKQTALDAEKFKADRKARDEKKAAAKAAEAAKAERNADKKVADEQVSMPAAEQRVAEQSRDIKAEQRAAATRPDVVRPERAERVKVEPVDRLPAKVDRSPRVADAVFETIAATPARVDEKLAESSEQDQDQLEAKVAAARIAAVEATLADRPDSDIETRLGDGQRVADTEQVVVQILEAAQLSADDATEITEARSIDFGLEARLADDVEPDKITYDGFGSEDFDGAATAVGSERADESAPSVAEVFGETASAETVEALAVPGLREILADLSDADVVKTPWLEQQLLPVETGGETETNTATAIVELDWEAELAKDDAEIFEDFSAALSAFIAEHAALLPRAEGDVITEPQDDSEMTDMLTPVQRELTDTVGITTIIEHLAALDDEAQAIAAPIMKDIVGALHGLDVLTTREADSATIATVEAELTALCMALFETIGLTDADEKTLAQFMAVLDHEDFRPAPVVQTVLERVGTHEVKRTLSWLASGLVRLEESFQATLHQALGSSAIALMRPVAIPLAA